MKYNVRDIKGIFTNSDSSDTSLEFIRDSHNFNYEIGYARTEALRHLEDYSFNGKIEAYEYCYISDDKIRKRVPDGLLREVLIVVCGLGTERIIYHVENGNVSIIHVEENPKDGHVLIYNTNGIVKIFTPDENYWYGMYWNEEREEGKYELIPLNRVDGVYITGFDFLPVGDSASGEIKEAYIEVLDLVNPWDADGGGLSPIPCVIRDRETDKVLTSSTVWFRAFGKDNSFSINPPHKVDVYRYYTQQLGSDGSSFHINTLGFEFNTGTALIQADNSWSQSYAKQQIQRQFDEQIIFTYNAKEVSSINGFTAKKTDWLMTAVLDDSSEIVVDTKRAIKPSSGDYSYYGVEVQFQPPPDTTKRITQLVWYVKEIFNERDVYDKDYEEAYRVDLLADIIDPLYFADGIKITKQDLSGVLLTQNIGVFYDKRSYSLVESFIDYKEVDGVAYAISPNGVHVCGLGGGRILKDVFYRNQTIPLENVTNPIKIANVNGIPAVYNKDRLKLFGTDASDGIFVYQGGDSYELGIKNQYQFAETSEGIIQITPNGVVTLREDQNQISTAINDQIEEDWEKSSISYNNKLKHLYVYNDSYLLRVKYQNGYWEKFYGDFGGMIMKQNFKGETVYAKENKIFVLAADKASEAYLEFQNTDLGEKSLYFVILRVYLDLEVVSGSGRVLLESQGHTYEVPIKRGREVCEVVIPLLKDGVTRRVGADNVKMKLLVEDMDVKFYNKEVEYDVITKN